MTDLAAVRAKALEHERAMDAVQWYRVSDLARRWHLSTRTVREIAATELPYLEVSHGTQRSHRRYDPRDVAAYERRHKVTGERAEGAA